MLTLGIVKNVTTTSLIAGQESQSSNIVTTKNSVLEGYEDKVEFVRENDSIVMSAEVLNNLGIVKIYWSEDVDGALYRLSVSDVMLVVCLSEVDDEQIVTIYYDAFEHASNEAHREIDLDKTKNLLNGITNSLKEYGITFDNKTLQDMGTKNLYKAQTGEKATIMHFWLADSICILLSFVLMVGISFSMSRDNETGVVKQLSYTPMKLHTYVNIRLVLYSLLGFIQITFMLLLFMAFGVNIGTNFFGDIFIGLLFSISFGCFCMLASNAKNQISAISLIVLFILLPLFLLEIGVISFKSLIIKIILNISPVTSLSLLLKSFSFYGTLKPVYLVILVIQAIIYYILTLQILRKKTGRI